MLPAPAAMRAPYRHTAAPLSLARAMPPIAIEGFKGSMMTDEASAPSVGMLLGGAIKALANAKALFREADILAAHGATARALCLHQISLEECAKIDSLGAWAASRVMGFEVDEKKKRAAFTRHEAKNRSNAYMLELSDTEIETQKSGDVKGARAAFEAQQNEFHQTSNRNKNAALYVDWGESGFVSPEEQIDAGMLDEIRKLNGEYLYRATLSMKMFARLESEPDTMKALLTPMIDGIEAIEAKDGVNFFEAATAVFEDFLEAGVEKFKSEPPAAPTFKMVIAACRERLRARKRPGPGGAQDDRE